MLGSLTMLGSLAMLGSLTAIDNLITIVSLAMGGILLGKGGEGPRRRQVTATEVP